MRTITRLGLVAALALPIAGCQANAAPPTLRAAAPSPVATAQASAAPAASASAPARSALPAPSTPPTKPPTGHLFPSDAGKLLAPGRYDVGLAFAAPLELTVPSGFTLGALRDGSVAVSGDAGFLGVFAADAVFADPCKAAPTVPTADADALVHRLRSMRGFVAGPISEGVVGGRRARSFEISNGIDTATAGCARGPMLPMFTSVGNPEGEATNGGTHQVVWVVDQGAHVGLSRPPFEGPILVVADSFATNAQLDVLEAIVRSLAFTY